jgi:hypothetical protein
VTSQRRRVQLDSHRRRRPGSCCLIWMRKCAVGLAWSEASFARSPEASKRLEATTVALGAKGAVSLPPKPSPPFSGLRLRCQGLLAFCAACGTVLATRRRAHERCWRGGGSLGKTRPRSYRLPRLHHRVSRTVSREPPRRRIASGTRSGDRSDRPGLRWSGCHPLAGCSDGVGHRSPTRAAATRDHESAHRAYALPDCVPSAS